MDLNDLAETLDDALDLFRDAKGDPLELVEHVVGPDWMEDGQ